MAAKGNTISAFAAYNMKRRSLDNSIKQKKAKKARASLGNLTPSQETKQREKIKHDLKSIKADKQSNGTKTSLNKTLPVVSLTKLARQKKRKSHSPAKIKGVVKKIFEQNVLNDEDPVKSSKKYENKSKSSESILNSSKSSNRTLKSRGQKLKRQKKNLKERVNKKKNASPINGENQMDHNSASVDFDIDKEIIEKLPVLDSAEEGKTLFQWLIHPVKIEDFFEQNWEMRPLHIKRKKSNYYKQLMSTPILDSVLRNFFIKFTENIDITSYNNGERTTHNPPGRAHPTVVWDYYMNGCSVRMLNPQSFIPKLHTLNATLQEYFGCFVGANSYLTPPDSQGFAPHYDDIEAFILQIEGKKRWRLYGVQTDGDYLARNSSGNFTGDEIGEPILDTVVEAGDLLYFPRGTTHQGETIDGVHSLHITLSVYQKNSWCDFLEKLIPEALDRAIMNDCEFRRGLPLDYLRHVGLVYSNTESEKRTQFITKTKELLHQLVDHIDVDKAADSMALRHIYDYLPPALTAQETVCSVYEDGERMVADGVVENRVEIEPDTRVRLLKANCVRLVDVNGDLRIYYSTENSKVYHEYEPEYLEISRELAPAVEAIILNYPDFVAVEDLPIEDDHDKLQVVKDLWEKGILVTDEPLPVAS
ncbi:ribosomal oxygenase 1 isoform X2 [Cephus cinctus]|nr:ribosomal oxygenase 1 isoform X2 [Cephus cinctus]